MALFRYDNDVTLNAPTYQSLAGVNIYVCSQPSNANQASPNLTPIPPMPLATIYADVNGTPLANPVVSDENGHYFFYVAPGTYDIVVNDPNGRLVSTLVYIDQSIGVASGGAVSGFQTNGVPNASQAVLNIQQGTGITAVNSGGTVTISNTGFTPTAVSAGLVYSGPVSGSAAIPTFRALVGTDLPAATGSVQGAIVLTNNLGGTAASPTVVATSLAAPLPVAQGGTGSNLATTGGTSQVLIQASTGAAITVAQLAFTDISGVAANGQIPAPTISSLGGIEALASATAHQFVTFVDTSGIQHLAQPAFTDISGTAANSQIPFPTVSLPGGLVALSGATAHQFVTFVDTSGVQHLAQPAFTDISGSATNAQLPAAVSVTSVTTSGFVSVGSTITNYNGLATAGEGVAPILVYAATTPTTPVSATNILASAPAGLYRVSYYSVVTTTGTVGTNFKLNFIYTDAFGAQTQVAFTNTTFTAGDVNQGTFIIQNQSTNNIQYSITEGGSFTVHPVLALKIALERIA